MEASTKSHFRPLCTKIPSARTLTTCLVIWLSLLILPSSSKTKVHLHALIPYHFMASREMESAFFPSFLHFKRNYQYTDVFKAFQTTGNLTFLRHDDPLEILNTMCHDVLGSRAITLININNPVLGERPSANAYILDVAQTLGLPVISWDAEFSGAPKTPQASLALQIAPTIQHQARAIFSLLQRYNWTQFSVVTTRVSGYMQFLATLQSITLGTQVKSRVTVSGQRHKSFKILQQVLVSDWRNVSDVKFQLNKLSGTDTRIIVLHAGSGGECYTVMETAALLGLTGRSYQWILTQTAISISIQAHNSFPIGTLGLTYDHKTEAMKDALRTAVKVWFTALLDLARRPANRNDSISFPTSARLCNASDADLKWKDGEKMYKALRDIRNPRDPRIQFDGNGTLRQTELTVINCQWSANEPNSKKWQEVGGWMRHGLVMRDIVWPGGSSMPPTGMPARAFLRIATLREKPYVMYVNPGADGKCSDHAVQCRIYERDDEKRKLSNTTIPMCCIGLSIDLLRVFSRELNFDFDLFEVEDGMWGAINKTTGRWNGPIKMLLDQEADMVVTSLKINPDRSSAVRFSVPFLETGITIVVSLREGAISPTAFLEPYDYPSWSLILVFSVHATGASIFIFEWLSPYGLNRGKSFFPDHRFSLFRSFWMIWAMLFSAAVDTDNPKGVSSRFLANIWALFALVFLASYTANLAAFMITKEEYYDISGIQDWRLQHPTHMNPPFKYATIPEGNTETNIRNNHPKMYHYMKPYNKPDVTIGIEAVKSGEIHAFIYDATVLEYYVGKDPGCRLRTVGNWYAMSGYGVAFPPGNNPWIDKINKVIFQLQENGEMERLQKFWLAGACYFEKDKKGVSNKTLGILNFTSAFILLGGGVLLSLILLVLEFFYFRFGRRCLVKAQSCRWCGFVSLSLGQSLTPEPTVRETAQLQKRCRDQLCDTQIWRLKHQLDLALLKIENLQNQISSGARRYTEPDITRQVGYQDPDYSQYNGAARRHASRDDFYQSDRMLEDENCDSRSEGGGLWRIRRSPSYTCAIGGDLLSDMQRLSNKSRQHEGKLYVGVDSSGNSSESVM